MPSDETVSDLPKRIAMLLATACTQGLTPSETRWLAVPVLEAGMPERPLPIFPEHELQITK